MKWARPIMLKGISQEKIANYNNCNSQFFIGFATIVKILPWLYSILQQIYNATSCQSNCRERERNKSRKKFWGPAGNPTQDLLNASQVLLVPMAEERKIHHL